ncbi:MAG: diguanylate cyclase [Anaerolineales bacterium]|nr:MAG: diguanylate cyclase [Anaerolineales bacterium]
MKILVLNNDLMERTVIQHVLQVNGHEIVNAENSDTAMYLLQNGDIRFIIADRSNTDMDEKAFIRKVREAKPPYYVYILLITAKVQDADVTTPRLGADDYLNKPIVPAELKSRVHIGERILALGDNLVHAKDTLDNLAMVDTLTGALNQIAFMIFSRGELERARRGQAPLSLIAFDVDNFKATNEKYGRNIGNDVLTVIAQGIREKSRPYDGLGRFESDAFMLILPGVIGADAEKIADRIIKGIENTRISMLDGTELKVSLSAGIVSSVRVTVSTDMDALVERTKEAVSMAKREGGDQIYTIYV